MKDARNKYAVHFEPENIPPMPFLEKPYQIACGYTNFLSHLDGLIMRPLENYREEFQEEIGMLFPVLQG